MNINQQANSSHGNVAASSCTNLSSPAGQPGKGYALVLPSSTLTAPIGSKTSGGLSSSSSERPRSAHLPPVAPSPISTATTTTVVSPAPPRSPVISSNPHSPFYLYMADVPRNRHYESLESLQHAFSNSINSSTLAQYLPVNNYRF